LLPHTTASRQENFRLKSVSPTPHHRARRRVRQGSSLIREPVAVVRRADSSLVPGVARFGLIDRGVADRRAPSVAVASHFG
jgi:hypothetical protein